MSWGVWGGIAIGAVLGAWLSDRIAGLQSGDMNLYLALIGLLLIIVLGVGVI